MRCTDGECVLSSFALYSQAVADLQRLVKELQRSQPSEEHIEREAAEKVGGHLLPLALLSLSPLTPPPTLPSPHSPLSPLLPLSPLTPPPTPPSHPSSHFPLSSLLPLSSNHYSFPSVLSSSLQAQLKSQLASLRSALANKEEEARRLGQTLGLKDATIGDLQQQLKQAEEERDREAERAEDLQREKSELQVYIHSTLCGQYMPVVLVSTEPTVPQIVFVYVCTMSW